MTADESEVPTNPPPARAAIQRPANTTSRVPTPGDRKETR